MLRLNLKKIGHKKFGKFLEEGWTRNRYLTLCGLITNEVATVNPEVVFNNYFNTYGTLAGNLLAT